MAKKKHKKGTRETVSRPSAAPFVTAFFVTVGIVFTASFFPRERVWGANIWGHLASGWPWILAAATVIVGLVAWLAIGRVRQPSADQSESGASPWRYVAICTIAIILLGAAFYLFRTTTHFLGDGYLQLSIVGSANPVSKFRDLGENLAHVWLSRALGGPSEGTALASYRILSMSAGLLLAVAAMWFAGRRYRRWAHRLLFCAGVLSGGYMLLFFGYVENYSLLALSIGLFTLVGMAAMDGLVSRWLILVPLAMAVFFHVLGVTLIPTAVYVLTAGTTLGRRVAQLSATTKGLAVAVLLVVAGAVFLHYYEESYFFRFAFLPLVRNRFTAEGYTLFSGAHLLDFANLIFVLQPAVIVLLTYRLFRRRERRLAPSERLFFAVLLASVLGATFIFDPKLGMPRDWDLFSIAGLPLAVWMYMRLLARDVSTRTLQVGTLAVLLSLAVLIPRVAAWHDRQMGRRIAASYVDLDVAKNRTGLWILGNESLEHGDTAAFERLQALRSRRYPEEALARQAEDLEKKQQFRATRDLAQQMVRMAPNESVGWKHLSAYYLAAGQADSALVTARIADGLNPHSFQYVIQLGSAYYLAGNFDQAERVWKRSIELDSTQFFPFGALSLLYNRLHEPARSIQYLNLAATRADAAPWVFTRLAKQAAADSAFADAAKWLDQAIDKGLDSAALEEILEDYPALREHLADQ